MANLKAMALAKKVNINEAFLQESARHILDLAYESGLWLIEIKQTLPHGSFMDFCEKNVEVKKSQINNYMSVAKAGRDEVEKYISKGLIGGISGFLSRKDEARRDTSGKFVAGNSGGPGRGHKSEAADDSPSGKQHIYVICNPLIPDWVKVGMSDNPCRRAKEMQTYAPEDYFVAYQAELPEGFRDTTIHPFLSSNFDSNREWFRCPADDAIDIIKYHLDGLTDERFAA
jgi:hypothetical protein